MPAVAVVHAEVRRRELDLEVRRACVHVLAGQAAAGLWTARLCMRLARLRDRAIRSEGLLTRAGARVDTCGRVRGVLCHTGAGHTGGSHALGSGAVDGRVVTAAAVEAGRARGVGVLRRTVAVGGGGPLRVRPAGELLQCRVG